MSGLILFVIFIGMGLTARKLFRAAKNNPEAALYIAGAARKLLKR